jgi:AcrR family transcriptional regulator
VGGEADPAKAGRTRRTDAAAATAGTPGQRRERVRAGGRSERVRLAVAAAVLELLSEGCVEFGPGEVAERAGVGRKTIYRWWPTYADLVREGLAEHSRVVEPPDTGSWPEDIRRFAVLAAEFFTSPVEVSTTAIMAGRRNPELAKLVLEHFEPVLESWYGMVERGVERGEVAPDCDVRAVVNMFVSPLILSPLLLHRRPTEEELDAFVTLILRATAPRDRG